MGMHSGWAGYGVIITANLLKTKKLYMIQRRSDGLYSTGGQSPDFTQYGKAWTGIGHLKNHLRLFDETTYDYKTGTYHKIADVTKIYADCDIVVFEIAQTETERFNIGELIEGSKDV